MDIATTELESLKENQATQENLMHQLTRQRDTYKVLCEQGGMMLSTSGNTTTTTSNNNNTNTSLNTSRSVIDMELELTKVASELDTSMKEHKKLRESVAEKERSLNETITKKTDQVNELKLESDRLKNKFDHR